MPAIATPLENDVHIAANPLIERERTHPAFASIRFNAWRYLSIYIVGEPHSFKRGLSPAFETHRVSG
ncbi:MAG: hypothetical protein AB7E81_13645 [Hyphomicrobiaceae bacterium]